MRKRLLDEPRGERVVHDDLVPHRDGLHGNKAVERGAFISAKLDVRAVGVVDPPAQVVRDDGQPLVVAAHPDDVTHGEWDHREDALARDGRRCDAEPVKVGVVDFEGMQWVCCCPVGRMSWLDS